MAKWEVKQYDVLGYVAVDEYENVVRDGFDPVLNTKTSAIYKNEEDAIRHSPSGKVVTVYSKRE